MTTERLTLVVTSDDYPDVQETLVEAIRDALETSGQRYSVSLSDSTGYSETLQSTQPVTRPAVQLVHEQRGVVKPGDTLPYLTYGNHETLVEVLELLPSETSVHGGLVKVKQPGYVSPVYLTPAAVGCRFVPTGA